MAGSARSAGRTLAAPANGGPRLVFDLGHLARDEEAAITYRVRVGPGALQGDGTNRVQATYTANGVSTASNVATAKVQVLGGVFSDRGFILGKVFLDCNASGTQERGEIGMPGVRLFIEDGTFVVTDSAAKDWTFAVDSKQTLVVVKGGHHKMDALKADGKAPTIGEPESRSIGTSTPRAVVESAIPTTIQASNNPSERPAYAIAKTSGRQATQPASASRSGFPRMASSSISTPRGRREMPCRRSRSGARRLPPRPSPGPAGRWRHPGPARAPRSTGRSAA